jgi:23S rRNA (guanosine2251-2'-O)-methyltransferase
MSQEICFGIHSVLALLRSHPEQIRTLWIAEEAQNPRLQQICGLASQIPIRIRFCNKTDLTKRLGHNKHQNILAECRAPSPEDLPSLPELISQSTLPLVLVLDGIQDPHNLGACLRTANALGVTAVIAPKDRAATLTPTVRKVAAGAAEMTPFFGVTNIARTLTELKELGLWIAGTSLSADLRFSQMDATIPLAVVMGAEDKGMRSLTETHCDFLIGLPMLGQIQSLNVSVATGICLYEIQRQRGQM